MYKNNYYNVAEPGSYGGLDSLARRNRGVKKKVIQKWLEGEDTYTMHKPIKRKFRRQKVIVGGINHQFQAGLIDLKNIKKWNKKINYLLTCIDMYSLITVTHPSYCSLNFELILSPLL